MVQFTKEELDLLSMSVATRIQRVESLIATFNLDEDKLLRDRYTEEFYYLTILKKKINETN